VSKWIRADEEMPPALKDVQIYQRYGLTGAGFQLVGKWIPAFTEEDQADGDWFDYDDDGNTWMPEGWYENQYNWNEYAAIHIPPASVTHWHYLEEPPQ
jgi:hypothetical protein